MSAVFEPFVTATSWMLLHSLWQFGLVFLLFYLLLRLIPEHLPQLRYLSGLMSLAAMLCWAGFTWIQNYKPVLAISPATMPAIVKNEPVPPVELNVPIEIETANPTNISYFETIKSILDQHIHWLFAGWFFFFVIHFVRFILGLLKIHHLNHSSQSDPPLTQLLKQVQTRLNLRRKVQVKVNQQISSPWVTGMMAPVILVPFNVATGMTSQQLEHILLHELIHIKHQDFLVNLVQSLIGTIFFFNPFVFWLNESIRFERECRCDQLSLKFTDPQPYRHTLLKVMEGNMSGEFLPVGILGRPHTLFRRFQRMQYRHSTREKLWIYFLLVGLLFSISIWTLKGQDSTFSVVQPALSKEYIHIITPDEDTINEDILVQESRPEPDQPVLSNENLNETPDEEKAVQTDDDRNEIIVQKNIFDKPTVSVFINGKEVNPDQGFELQAVETVFVKLSDQTRKRFGPSLEMKLWLGRGKRPLDQATISPGEIVQLKRPWESKMIQPGDYLLVTARGSKQDSNTWLLKIPIIESDDASARDIKNDQHSTYLQEQVKVYINDKEIDPKLGFQRAAIDNILFTINKEAGKASDYNVEVYLARGSRPIDKIESDNLQQIEWNLPIEEIRAGDRLVIRITPKNLYSGSSKPDRHHINGTSEQATASEILISIPVTPDEEDSQSGDSVTYQPVKSNPFQLVGEPAQFNFKTTTKLQLDGLKVRMAAGLESAKKDTLAGKPNSPKSDESTVNVLINDELVNVKDGYTFNDFNPIESISLKFEEGNFRKMVPSEPITFICYLGQGAKVLVSDDSPGFEKIIEAINNHNYGGDRGLRLVFEMKNTALVHVLSVPLIETSPAWVQIGQKKYSSGEIKIDTTFDHLYFGISDQVFELLKGEQLNVEMFFYFEDGKKGEAVITMQVLEDMKKGFYVQFGASETRVLVGQRIALIGGKPEDYRQLHIDISALKPGVNEDLLNLTIELPGGDE